MYQLILIYVENLLYHWNFIFDVSFKFTSVPFFIPDFNLLNCELHNFTFKALY